MTAEEFTRSYNEVCGTYLRYACLGCPFSGWKTGRDGTCLRDVFNHPAEAEKVMRKWKEERE